MDYWLWGLAVFTLLLGFVLGRRSQRRRDKSRLQDRHLILDESSQKYISGLNYLLSEEGDAAAEAFIDALPVSRETLETHLLLGRTLRKSGEIASAIRTHQSLLASPYLENHHVDSVQLELAVDYISAGLLDRAETLLLELVRSDGVGVRQQALEHLVALYRDESEWAKAIEAINRHSERRFGRASDEWAIQQSHFSCELADRSIKSGQVQDANRQVRAALAFDKRSRRAGLLAVRLHILGGDYRRAWKKLKKLIDSGCEYWGEIVPLAAEIYNASDKPESMMQYLLALGRRQPSGALISMLYQELCAVGQTELAREFLLDLLGEDAPLAAISTLLEMPEVELGILRPVLLSQLARLEESYPAYTCGGCGYSSQQLYWLCPACKSWGEGQANHRPKSELGKLGLG